MKLTFRLLILLFLLTGNSCNKEDDLTPEEQLPQATQTGEGTFACLVNGELFNDTDGRYFNCYYQFVDGGYYFFIEGTDESNSIIDINLSTNKKEIFEGETYKLSENIEGNVWAGGYFIISNREGKLVTTSLENTGSLKITKLDFEKRIVSGTFEFDIVHPETGEIIEVRQGRFDTLFTQ